MATNLGLGTRQNGDRKPLLRWGATGERAGQFYISSTGEVVEPPFGVDCASTRTGSLRIEQGLAPEARWDRVLGEPDPRPSGDGWKRGFSVPVLTRQGHVLELMSNASLICGAFAELFAAFEIAPEARGAAQIPLVDVVDINICDSPYGLISEPVFAIVSWQPRPSSLRLLDRSALRPSSSSGGRSLARDLDAEIPF